MDQEQRARRAAQYKSIFENTYYSEATEMIKAKLHKEFEETKPEEAAVRERIYLSLRLMDKLHSTITAVIASGELDRKQIADLTGKPKAIRDFF